TLAGCWWSVGLDRRRTLHLLAYNDLTSMDLLRAALIARSIPGNLHPLEFVRYAKSAGAANRPRMASTTIAPVSTFPGGRDLDHPRRLLLGRQAPLWGKLINQVRQILTQASKQLVPAQPGLLAQRVERIAAERMRQILGRDVLVRAGADPGLRDAAVSA